MIQQQIENLCLYAKKYFRLSDEDLIYSRNRLCHALRLEPVSGLIAEGPCDDADTLLAPLVEYAVEHGITTRDEANAHLFDTYLIDLFLPRPSEIAAKFAAELETFGPKTALRHFYDFCIAANYIRMNDVNRNIIWDFADGNRTVIVTVNKSKPEKDNKEIARLRALPQSSYPKCQLCLENLGYAGRLNHPARENIRVLPLTLAGERWYMQYSPYVYYNEHCIVFSKEHRPMTMDRTTFLRLAEFVEQFPCYFLGSNACLPIVGGSILTHEHYQGGGFVMPLQRVPSRELFPASGSLRVGIADWYNSVIRLVSPNKEEIVDAAAEICSRWQSYDNPALDILSREGDTPHNAVTPIFRRSGENFVAEFILRNNRCSEQYPDGIFHAHPEYHNIKKEGIGIIEVMGLFILPGRLDEECAAVADCLFAKKPLPKRYALHQNMFLELRKNNYEDLYAAKAAVRAFINRTCIGILQNTAVFKEDEAGQNAFRAFVRSLSFVKSSDSVQK